MQTKPSHSIVNNKVASLYNIDRMSDCNNQLYSYGAGCVAFSSFFFVCVCVGVCACVFSELMVYARNWAADVKKCVYSFPKSPISQSDRKTQTTSKFSLLKLSKETVTAQSRCCKCRVSRAFM